MTNQEKLEKIINVWHKDDGNEIEDSLPEYLDRNKVLACKDMSITQIKEALE